MVRRKSVGMQRSSRHIGKVPNLLRLGIESARIISVGRNPKQSRSTVLISSRLRGPILPEKYPQKFNSLKDVLYNATSHSGRVRSKNKKRRIDSRR